MICSIPVVTSLFYVQVRAEVVIVDDASTDSTVSRVVNFIESRRKHPVANIT